MFLVFQPAVQSTPTSPSTERVYFKDRVTIDLEGPPSFYLRSAADAVAQEDAMSLAQGFNPT